MTLVATTGIVVGKGFQANFKLYDDSEVDAAHGTLECTLGLGVWVYSDHSRYGSILNGDQSVHNNAVVVHHGDTLKVGRTEVKLSLKRGTSEAIPEEKEANNIVSSVGVNQETELSARNIARMARRRASTSWESAGAVSKLQQAKERLPRIETLGLDFVAVETSMATPPEYTVSPLPETRWQIPTANATAEAARNLPSTLLKQHGHPQSFHRPCARFVEGFDMPFTSIHQQPEAENSSKKDLPPPLEYSSSPAVSPSSLAARQRYNLLQQPPTSVPVSVSALIAKVSPPPTSTGGWPSSRRDDLRIQVSKKMAAAAPVGAGKATVPRVFLGALEPQPPASPVAQRDLFKQQLSLQTILQAKFEEEKLLKQQQEEWMRQKMMSVISNNNNEMLASTLHPPVENEKSSLDTDPNELVLFPAPTPVPLLGLRQHQILKPTSRVSAATPTSQARLNSFEERFNETRCNAKKERHKTTALASELHKWEVIHRNPAKEIELRSSDESVISTATTMITCHRRVMSSLSSSCTSSVDLFDFLGYEEEEDTDDMITSYTTPKWIN
ncbi:unnamed protein product [Peronospora farinosa]|uniref:FHA domain-containing protein n=1 Tax=Peronospora farinosa TaxID=134698 RepID=A0ABN8C871_9STRA|nr:unnamed protein product [Peronospora farinosa]